jgi:hypothetical protein
MRKFIIFVYSAVVVDNLRAGLPMRSAFASFFLFFFIFSTPVCSQVTSISVSDSVKIAWIDLEYDTLIQHLETFRDSNNIIYTNVGSLSGKLFRGISHSDPPQSFIVNVKKLTRAWHIYEMENWISGTCGTNFTSLTFSNAGSGRQCTITVSGENFQGTATNDTDAMGRAFYSLLFDPDFPTFIQ